VPVFPEFFEARVQVPHVRNAAPDGLPFELEHQAEHTVGGRVLGPEIDEHMLAAERILIAA
jgi:hypothetical protein